VEVLSVIVASLLFVAVEVRGSNQVSRHREIEELLEDYRGVRMSIATNADVARALLSGLHNFDVQSAQRLDIASQLTAGTSIPARSPESVALCAAGVEDLTGTCRRRYGLICPKVL
jgi:hypothetical protein